MTFRNINSFIFVFLLGHWIAELTEIAQILATIFEPKASNSGNPSITLQQAFNIQ